MRKTGENFENMKNDIKFVANGQIMKKYAVIPPDDFAQDPAAVYTRQSARRPSLSSRKAVAIARNGVRVGYLLYLGKMMDIHISMLAKILNVSLRTLQRYTPDMLLDPDASSKVMRLGALNAHGLEVLGSQDAFNSWLKSELQALEGDRPIDLLDTSFGFELVDDILGRIEHGIYS